MKIRYIDKSSTHFTKGTIYNAKWNHNGKLVSSDNSDDRMIHILADDYDDLGWFRSKFEVIDESEKYQTYLVVVDDEMELKLRVRWSVNLPNNPSFDEIIEEYINENYGDVTYSQHRLDSLEEITI